MFISVEDFSVLQFEKSDSKQHATDKAHRMKLYRGVMDTLSLFES